MSALVLLNVSNKLGKMIKCKAYRAFYLFFYNEFNKFKCKACRAFYLFFHNEFNKFNNTGAQMLDSMYHMA